MCWQAFGVGAWDCGLVLDFYGKIEMYIKKNEQLEKLLSRIVAHLLSPLRCGRDSNSRPHA